MKFNEYILTSKSICNINLKERTKKLYMYLFNQYIVPYFLDFDMAKLDEAILQDFLIYLANKDLSTNTIKLIWRIL